MYSNIIPYILFCGHTVWLVSFIEPAERELRRAPKGKTCAPWVGEREREREREISLYMHRYGRICIDMARYEQITSPKNWEKYANNFPNTHFEYIKMHLKTNPTSIQHSFKIHPKSIQHPSKTYPKSILNQWQIDVALRIRFGSALGSFFDDSRILFRTILGTIFELKSKNGSKGAQREPKVIKWSS